MNVLLSIEHYFEIEALVKFFANGVVTLPQLLLSHPNQYL